MTKLSEFIKNGVTNFVTNPTFGGIFNFNQQNDQSKMPKQLDINKSPFEIPKAPIDEITKDPLGFETIQYPADLGSAELGHFILFFTLTNRMVSDEEASMDLEYSKSLGLNTGDNAEKISVTMSEDSGTTLPGQTGVYGKYTNKRRTTLRSQFTDREIDGKAIAVNNVDLTNTTLEAPQGQIVTSAIALYMPADVKVSYKAGWDTEAAELAGDIAEVIKGVRAASGTMAMFTEAIKGGYAAVTGYVKQIGGEALSAFGGGDAFKLTSKAFGIAINPRKEMYYEGPQFRQFQYSFRFYPRNKEETKRVQSIIKLFKYHMHPITDDEYYGRMYRIPSEFEIHYLCKSGVNDKLNKISRCALSDCDVTYNPEGNWKTFEDDAPVSYQVDLTFKELEYMTKQKMKMGF